MDRTNDSYSSLHTFQEYGVLYTHFHAYIPFATITTVVHQLLLLLSTFTASDPATIIKKSGMLLLLAVYLKGSRLHGSAGIQTAVKWGGVCVKEERGAARNLCFHLA